MSEPLDVRLVPISVEQVRVLESLQRAFSGLASDFNRDLGIDDDDSIAGGLYRLWSTLDVIATEWKEQAEGSCPFHPLRRSPRPSSPRFPARLSSRNKAQWATRRRFWRRNDMLRLVAYSPETPPRRVVEIGESELGHLKLFEDGELLANIVIRPFTEAHEVEVGVADSSWEWLARTQLPTSPA